MTSLLGNCLELMPLLPDKSVDLWLADLPYGTTNCKWDTPINLQKLWSEYQRTCKGAIVLFAQTPFDKVLGASNLEMLRYEWIWEKTHPTGHLNAKKMPMKAHENILVFYDKLPTYNFQKTYGHKRKSAVKRGDKTEIYGKQNFEAVSYNSTERYPRSVLKFASDKQKGTIHPTQKPIALLEYLIKTYTNEGDLVADNVAGSFSTRTAAHNLNRKFWGCEIDEDIFYKTNNRG